MGALMMLVVVQLSPAGLYLPPVLNELLKSCPPQMIISLPVHTAVWPSRPVGALEVVVTIQLSAAGLYLPPVFEKVPPVTRPPQTINSLPVQTPV